MSRNNSLKQYLERGAILKKEKLFQLLSPALSRKKMAAGIFKEMQPSKGETAHELHQLHPLKYRGSNLVAKNIAALFQETQLPSVVSVIVHGSIGAEDEITYSDFDGVILIDPSEIRSVKDLYLLRTLLEKTELLMLHQDVLQHHGWKILLLPELQNYPDADLPLEILQHGKLLYPDIQNKLSVNISPGAQHYGEPIKMLITSILRKCDKRPGDLFILKVLLSEIMLLPAFFLQAIHQKGFSKKETFELFYAAYPEINSGVIRDASHWRLNWVQSKPNYKLMLFHRLRKSGIYLSGLAPEIPREIEKQLTDEWYFKLRQLCNEMTAAIRSHHPD